MKLITFSIDFPLLKCFAIGIHSWIGDVGIKRDLWSHFSALDLPIYIVSTTDSLQTNWNTELVTFTKRCHKQLVSEVTGTEFWLP